MKNNYNEDTKRFHIYTETTIKCKHCGHSVNMGSKVDKMICGWCGYYIFKNKKAEFNHNLKLAILKANKKEII